MTHCGSGQFLLKLPLLGSLTTTVNNRQQPTTNPKLSTTTVNDTDQSTTSVVWLNILFTRSAKNSSGMKGGSMHAPVNGGPVFPGNIFRTFLDLKTTFWLSIYHFLHCLILLLHCRLKLILELEQIGLVY